jgi:hypothetical protein
VIYLRLVTGKSRLKGVGIFANVMQEARGLTPRSSPELIGTGLGEIGDGSQVLRKTLPAINISILQAMGVVRHYTSHLNRQLDSSPPMEKIAFLRPWPGACARFPQPMQDTVIADDVAAVHAASRASLTTVPLFPVVTT